MPTYTGISSEAFRHPLDKEAEVALRSVPGFDLIASKFVEFIYERPQYVYLMGNALQVGPRQYASIYHVFRECVRDLDILVSSDGKGHKQVNSAASKAKRVLGLMKNT